MLEALVDGTAWPATDLARVAGVAPSTASGHLAVLVEYGMVVATSSGRHRYYRLSGPDVARAIEALQVIAPSVPARSLRQHRVTADLVEGRTCYDHLAGNLGLRVADLLVGSGCIPQLEVRVHTELVQPLPAHPVVAALVLDCVAPAGRRPTVRGCLDWTGRRPHVAGALGAHVLELFRRNAWISSRPGSRAVRLTDAGHRWLEALETA